MEIGHVRIELIGDGTFWVDGGGAFGLVPRTRWETLIPPNAAHQIPLRADGLLIESQGKRILVDTGLGDKHTIRESQALGLSGERILTQLGQFGLGAEQIDIVTNTHLHADHAGGNTSLCEGKPMPAFPRAEYWLQRLELADARYPNERTSATYLPANFLPLEAAGQLRLIAGDTPITSEVCCMATPGHTRGHQSILIASGGRQALFLGDLSTLSYGIERLAWVTAFDVDPLQTIETKRRICRWAIEEEVLLIFMHDPNVRAGYLREKEGRWMLERVEL